MKKNILFLLSALAFAHQALPAACASDEQDDDASTLQELAYATKAHTPSIMRRASSAPDSSINKPKLATLTEEDEEEQQEEEPIKDLTAYSAPALPLTLPTIEELTTTIEQLKANLLSDPCFEVQLYDEPICTNLLIILQKNYLRSVNQISGNEPQRSDLIRTHLENAITTLSEALDQRTPLRLQALETFFATHPEHGSRQSFERVKTNSHPLITLETLYQYLIATPRALVAKTLKPSKNPTVVRAGSTPATHTTILRSAFDQAFPEAATARSSRSSSIKFADANQLEAVETFETDLDLVRPQHPLFPVKAKQNVHQQLLQSFANSEEERGQARQMRELEQEIYTLLLDNDEDNTLVQAPAQKEEEEEEELEEMRF